MDQDQELARRAAAGDAAAFAALVRAHEGAVRRFLGRLVRGSGADADDLAQDVFLKAWRTGARWRGDSTYRTWLLGIAWRTFLDSRRAGTRRAARETASFDENHACVDPDRAIDLARALATLGERERAAALLCFGEGCSHNEAARILGLPLGTLKSVLARARTTLAARLELV